MDSLTAARHRTQAAWIVPAVIATLVIGSLAAAAAGPRGPARASSALNSGASAAGPLSASVDASPFYPNADGVRDTVTLTVVLAAPATLSVIALDFDGKTVKVLNGGTSAPQGSSPWTWDGTNANSKLVADGAYVLRATAITADGTFTVDTWVAKDKLIPYPAAPGAVVVAIDSGHGKPDPGAYYQKIRESNMNLDIALRLQHMLESSGIKVVMTRTTDRAVNRPEVDISGDGTVTHDDELIIRNDIANLARADLHVVLMNNAYGCHCAQGTETYTSGERTWTPEGVALSRLVQAAHIARLKAFKSTTWKPNDRGVKLWDYAAIRPYKKGVMPRPDFMPSLLVESLFMDHPNELKVLAKRAARSALAAAYFDGIVKWLATRAYGLRYDVLTAPATAEAGSTADYAMHLTNRGNQASSGWVLEARMVSAAPGQPYDGSPVRGTLVAQAAIPDGLAPGQALNVPLNGVPVPTVAGDWMVKFDVRLPSGGTLQDHGVVGPQLPLTTTVTPPPSTPTPQPTDSPTPELTDTPVPTTAPTDTPAPTPAPTPSPTDSPADSPSADPGSPSPDPSLGTGAAPADRGTAGIAGVDSIAVPPGLFARALPYDPDRGLPGAGGAVHWGLRETWRRYITPIDIPPDSIRGQYGLDSDGH